MLETRFQIGGPVTQRKIVVPPAVPVRAGCGGAEKSEVLELGYSRLEAAQRLRSLSVA
jgi:hypothetical protein